MFRFLTGALFKGAAAAGACGGFSHEKPLSDFLSLLSFYSTLYSSLLCFLYTLLATAVWPDLAKFRRIGNKIKSLWPIFRIAHLVFGKLVYQLWHFYATGQILIVVSGKILNSI